MPPGNKNDGKGCSIRVGKRTCDVLLLDRRAVEKLWGWSDAE